MSIPPKRVRDTWLHRVFPSLNQCYLTLLREGKLEEMSRAGKLSRYPERDSFGYYKMRRFYLGRFVQEDEAGRQETDGMTSTVSKEQLDVLRQGWQTWNDWRKRHPQVIPVLRKANLAAADLSNANLAGADLSWADLYQADLSGADLTHANLSGASLREARAERATLHRAVLTERGAWSHARTLAQA